MIKEILFFCYGDSSKASTWSNVPYLFTKTLYDRGIVVHRIDISPNKYISALYDRIVYPITKLTGNYCVFRFSRFLSRYTYKKIEKNVRKYSSADYCIFTCFDYYNKFNNIKTLLYCDWTYDAQIKDRLHRELTKKEQKFLIQQKEALDNANYVISLFPECAEHIRQTYPCANVSYLDGYVINSLYSGKLSSVDIIKIKRKSNAILFVGTKKYMEAALKLISAYKLLIEKGDNITLNIIGMKSDDFKITLPKGVKCYGYLKKDNVAECKTYYDILLSTSIIVNADPIWGGYSSIVEAMYFYTPIIVSPYDDFTKEFGYDIPFGRYNQSYTSTCIANNIEDILGSDNYDSYCIAAHKRVENFTWPVYVDKILKLIDDDK